MRYCSNDLCDRKSTCLRYELAKPWMDKRDWRNGWFRVKRLGNWVAYKNGIEARKCTQYIDKDIRLK